MSIFNVLEVGSNGSITVYAEGLSKARAVRVQQQATYSERCVRQWVESMAGNRAVGGSSFVVEEAE